jgi:serine/threonine protein kinase
VDEPLLTVQSIVERARQLADAEERRAFLHQACANNVELRQRVEELLLGEESDSLLNSPTTASTREIAPGEWPDPNNLPAGPVEGVGSRIGPYKLLQQLGEGGMGVVFMAEQQQPVRRMVALKVIKAGMDTAQVIARFEAERQALALMDHPHIAKVLDAGTTQSGRPYFVMELVKGIPLTTYCDEQKLSPRQRLELFVPVCQAIQHAHQKGIIHRDIKPSNVLIASYDGKPAPKVIDFGVAKAMGGKLTEHTVFTGFGGLVGTFEYMSPEQAEFNALDIDTRSDIYSLGALLYELLTGTTPLTRQRVKEAPLTEVLRLIHEEEPQRPSTRLIETKSALSSVSAQRHMEPSALVKALRGEVDWIVVKCLEKERTRRYETANGLARDIQRYLADEPVEAGPPSAAYRLRKLAWKHRHGLATVAALLLLLVAGAVISGILAVKASRAEKRAVTDRDRARQAEEDAKAVMAFFQDKVLSAERPEGQEGGKGTDVTLRQAVDAAEPEIARAFGDRPLVEASIRDTLGETYYYLAEYTKAIQQHERALALRRASLGANHPDTLRSCTHLAEAFLFSERPAEAVRLLEPSLPLYEATFGTDHPDMLTCRDDLALAYRGVGRTAEAIRLHEQTLEQREAKLGLDAPDTLDSRNNVASVYLAAGRIALALRLFEQNLKLGEAKLGVNHPSTLIFRNHLATVYLILDRTAEAIRLHAQNLKQREIKLGPNHRQTFQSGTNLARAYERAGKLAQAESLYRDVLEKMRRAFGAESPDTAKQMSLVGRNLLLQHKYADAELMLRDSFKILEAKQPDGWVIFNVRSLRGAVLLSQKQYAGAESLLRDGYEGMKKREKSIRAEEKCFLREALERLVQLYQALGKTDEAAKWRKELQTQYAEPGA